MRSILIGNYKFLYTKNVRLVFQILIALLSILFIFISKIYVDPSTLDYYQSEYSLNYLYTGSGLLKLIILLYLMLFSLYAFSYNQYDVFFIVKSSKKEQTIAKLFIVILINFVYTTFMVLFFVIPLVILNNNLSLEIIQNYMLSFHLYATYYLLCFIMLISLFDTIFIVIVPIVGYFISTIFTEIEMGITDLSLFAKYWHIIFPDFVIENYKIQYVYGTVFVLVECIILLVFIILKNTRKDY